MNSTDQFRILVLATETADAAKLLKAIDDELDRKDVRDGLSLEQASAIRIDDLTRELLSHLGQSPGILHLCCRVEDGRLRFHPKDELVSGNALAAAIEATADLISATALSYCYTPEIAGSVTEPVAYVFGTTPAADDQTNLEFFRGFYRGLARGKEPSDAFGLGVAQVGLHGRDASVCAESGVPVPSVHPDETALEGGAPTRPGHAPVATGLTNLRPRNPSFVGRDALFGRIDDVLSSDKAFVTQVVAGMGGVGKTELAVEYAYRNQERYDLMWWLAVEKPETIPLQMDRLAGELEVEGADVAERLTKLARWFEENDRWLLIADNVENWDAVRPHLPEGGHGRVIVTTRNPAIHPDAIALDLFSPEEAKEFVYTRIREREADAPTLVENVGRLPLALEQACSYLLSTGCSIAEYTVLFNERAAELLDAGGTGGHDGTVAATFSLALEQAERLCEQDDLCGDPVGLATLFAFLAADDIPISLLRYIDG